MQGTSLVKYHTPILVSITNAKGKKGQKKPAVEKTTSQTEDILNSILPPREWTEDGQLWIQYVSSTPATRLDVINLQEQLDHQLQARQARETGICPIREELYAQCFDELIRQITINCAERGLLLLRVRDEARMTITAYETLYESSIAYGVRKALVAEQKRIDLDQKLRELASSKRELVQQVESLKGTIDSTLARSVKRREAEEKVHAEEVERIMKTNEQLKSSLETMLSAPKK
ncbi:sporangia induced 28 kDa inner dynein arm light chain [Ochromonadaceae sp. CCMP2298]|nr:sporangia induced 28 kDa inner dynein arm light chain [Ochromonadaceae sp. CCMP2298]